MPEAGGWGRPVALSLVLHGVVLAAATFFLPAREGPAGGADPGESRFEVSLLPPQSALPDGPEPSLAPALPPPSAPEPAVLPEPPPPVAEPPIESGVPGAAASGTSDSPVREPDGGGGMAAPDGSRPEVSGSPGDSPYQPPRLLAGALPIDPRDVEDLEVPPEIPVRIRVGVDGRVKEIEPLVPALPPPVMEAIRRSAEAMRFAPARRGREAVEAWFTMTFVQHP